MVSCTSYYEGTELKANHNFYLVVVEDGIVVLAITKVLNWKLITTKEQYLALEVLLY